MTFAEKLRELCDLKGLSEAILAERSGLPLGTVHIYRGVTWEVVRLLANGRCTVATGEIRLAMERGKKR